MNTVRLLRCNLCHHWRTHIGVVLGVAVGVAVLTGPLFVGDSVRATLQHQVQARLGKVQLALDTHDRFVRSALANELASHLHTVVAPVMRVRGVAALPDGSVRVNQVAVLGVDERFWQLAPTDSAPIWLNDNEVILNLPLAEGLGVQIGDRIVMRVEKPSALPRDVPLTSDADALVALPLVVKAIANDEYFGRFNLHANQTAPFNAIVGLETFASRLQRPGRANLLLVGNSSGLTLEKAKSALVDHWQLADAELVIHERGVTKQIELCSDRVFISPPVASAVRSVAGNGIGVLTYFVNELNIGEHATPYSMVTAIGSLHTPDSAVADLIPHDMADGYVVLNQWLAEDLQAGLGDTLTMTYYMLGSGRKLVEQRSQFTVQQVVAIDGAASDPQLMPRFPGLSDADHCRDWEAGIPIDLGRIRPKDEAYWHDYRGTPKAFITLGAGQAIWANAYGNLTAVRFPAMEQMTQRLANAICRNVDPSSLGFVFSDVRKAAAAARIPVVDFGVLFMAMSVFLIIAAMLLTGLIFVFGVEQRADEIGTLLVLGFEPWRVRWQWWCEGAVLAVAGVVIGVPAGWLYTRVVLHGLATLWRDAVAGATLSWNTDWSSAVIGAAASICTALLAMGWATHRKLKRPAWELLAVNGPMDASAQCGKPRTTRWWLRVAILSALAGCGLLLVSGGGRGRQAAGAFFAIGSLLLVAVLAVSSQVLASLGNATSRVPFRMRLGSVALRNNARRCGRSLATVALVACGVFLVVAVNGNRLDPWADTTDPSSGTGGFALWAQAAIPVVKDLNSPAQQAMLGLAESPPVDVRFLPLRVRDGDDASCLNLNRAQTPRLLGVDPIALALRGTHGAFTLTQAIESAHGQNPWHLLQAEQPDGAVPAIADHATLEWALHKNVGQSVTYQDQHGKPFQVRIVAVLADSILQGSLLIDQCAFERRFPGEAGFRAFLIDTPPDHAHQIAGTLEHTLADYGLEVTTTVSRLARFLSVQNTYLSIFQVLGGIGLLMGSAGLGVVVLRNVLERRSELALLRAVGFSGSQVRWMIFSEHMLLLVLGMACGITAAIVALIPVLHSSSSQIPLGWMVATLLALIVSGVIWVWAATVAAQHGTLLEALRGE